MDKFNSIDVLGGKNGVKRGVVIGSREAVKHESNSHAAS